MNPTHLVVRYGELFLKGKNRPFFEKKLVDNIKNRTNPSKVQKIPGRLILDYFPNHSFLKKIFGLVSYSPAQKVENDLTKIKETALKLVSGMKGSFKVVSKRSDKNFPLKSPQLSAIIGQYIEENSNLTFKMENPHNIIYIEINQKGIYLFTEIIPCLGGLPTGVEGKVLLLLEDKASILAGILMMKRGTNLLPVSLTGNKDLSLLNSFSPLNLKLEIFYSLQELENYASTHGVDILVTGQQFENLEKSEIDLVSFRPLIGYSDKEVKEQLAVFGF